MTLKRSDISFRMDDIGIVELSVRGKPIAWVEDHDVEGHLFEAIDVRIYQPVISHVFDGTMFNLTVLTEDPFDDDREDR